jgi:hypothetical protein
MNFESENEAGWEDRVYDLITEVLGEGADTFDINSIVADAITDYEGRK